MEAILEIMIVNAKQFGLEAEVKATYNALREEFPEKGIEWAAVAAQREWDV